MLEIIIPVFIKSVLSHNFGLSCMIQTKEKFYFAVDENFPRWCKYEPWYNATIFHNLHVPVFEDFFVILRQYIYELMCFLNSYDKLHESLSDEMRFGGGRSLPDDSTISSIVYLSFSANFINTLLKSLVPNFALSFCAY